MRGFEIALDKNGNPQFEGTQLPVYATKNSACADFFCAEDIEIPSGFDKPTLVHTGVKACMEEDEVLEIYTRSSMPKKVGVLLANCVGIIDADYYNNPDNDGEIMFAYYNLRPEPVVIKKGDRVGQGMFKKVLRPTINLRVEEEERKGGFGSTDAKN